MRRRHDEWGGWLYHTDELTDDSSFTVSQMLSLMMSEDCASSKYGIAVQKINIPDEVWSMRWHLQGATHQRTVCSNSLLYKNGVYATS